MKVWEQRTNEDIARQGQLAEHGRCPAVGANKLLTMLLTALVKQKDAICLLRSSDTSLRSH